MPSYQVDPGYDWRKDRAASLSYQRPNTLTKDNFERSNHYSQAGSVGRPSGSTPSQGGVIGGGNGSASSGYGYKEQPFNFPTWLSPNNQDYAQPLLEQYNAIPGAYDSTGQVNAINESMAHQTQGASEAANAAANEYTARAMQQGGSAVGAGVARAQAQLPVYAANAALRSQAADVVASNKQNANKMASEVAGQLGQLQQRYKGMLADYYNSSQNRALQSSQFSQSQAMDKARMAQQARQFDRSFNQQAEQTKFANTANSERMKMAAAEIDMKNPQPSGYIGFTPTGGTFQPAPTYADYYKRNGYNI